MANAIRDVMHRYSAECGWSPTLAEIAGEEAVRAWIDGLTDAQIDIAQDVAARRAIEEAGRDYERTQSLYCEHFRAALRATLDEETT